MERQVAVALYYRDRLSHGHSRKVLSYAAYHWGIIIIVSRDRGGGDCHSFDATDASEIDPTTWRMGNPNMDWWFRANTNIDLTFNAKLLTCIVIGIVPPQMSTEELELFFRQVPLPVKNTNPQQSCVTWTVDAIRTLQENQWVPGFDIDEFKGWALNYADERLPKRDHANVVIYPKLEKQGKDV